MYMYIYAYTYVRVCKVFLGIYLYVCSCVCARACVRTRAANELHKVVTKSRLYTVFIYLHSSVYVISSILVITHTICMSHSAHIDYVYIYAHEYMSCECVWVMTDIHYVYVYIHRYTSYHSELKSRACCDSGPLNCVYVKYPG